MKFKKFFLLALGMFAAAVLSELIVLVLLGEQVKFPRHVVEANWGLRYNEPGASYRHKSADGTWFFEINNQGMRADHDYSYAKPAGSVRILSLGDSFTVGYEVHEHETFSRVLEQELRKRGVNAEVLNCGVSGFSNAEALLYLERELLKYEPDLVLLSFYVNDLVDNVRTGLFAMEDGRLVERSKRYVPGGRLANYLNTSWLFNGLSGYSNAFALAKERITRMMKRSMVQSYQDSLEAEAGTMGGDKRDKLRSQKQLAAAILDRLYGGLQERSIPLVIQSIPTSAMRDGWPNEWFETNRPGLYYLPMKSLLGPHQRTTLMNNRGSHGHWTPSAHAISGRALADLILKLGEST